MESRYLIQRRALKLGKPLPSTIHKEKEKQDQKNKPVKKRSDELKAEMPELIKLYEMFLKKHQYCEIHGPNCTVKATCAHHSEGRIGDKLKDTTKWVPSCSNCNHWCESHPKEAKAKGVSKSRLTNEKLKSGKKGRV